MADELKTKKISELPLASTLMETDTLVANQGDGTKRVPASLVRDFLKLGTFVSTGPANLQADIDRVSAAGGGVLLCPAGSYSGPIVIKTGVLVKGAGSNSIISYSGTSGHAVSSEGFDAYSGTNNYNDNTPHSLGIVDFAIQGASKSTGVLNGISLYGYQLTLDNVFVSNVGGNGVQLEWGQYGEAKFGMESNFNSVHVDGCGQHGILHKGPHDSNFTNCVVIDASQKTDNAYHGFYSTGNGNSRSFNTHVWHRSAAVNRVNYAIWADGGCEFVACHAEGGRHQLYLGGNCVWQSCLVYAPRSTESQMVIDGAYNIVDTRFQANDASLDLTMLELGKIKKCERSRIKISASLSAAASTKPLVLLTNEIGSCIDIIASGWTGTTPFSGTLLYATDLSINQNFPSKVFVSQKPQIGYSVRFDGYGAQAARLISAAGVADLSYNCQLSPSLGLSSTDDATVGYGAFAARSDGLSLVVGSLGAAAKIPLKVTAAGQVTLPLIGNYASDSAAATAGVPVGGLYNNAGAVRVRLT